MAGLISTGIWGFICSAAMKAGKITSTFISGSAGWIIRNNGEAEFKSIYARDKIVTNEYVYNRIRVTEDEEIVSTNGKILSAAANEDGTFTISLDLRQGDLNGFADGDLLQGYYHSPQTSGVICSVQRLTVQSEPDMKDQSMTVACQNGSTPYLHMIIVRVGNTKNEDRRAHIRISSRTNCQYFYDGIAAWPDMDDPEKVRCVLGKADMGLIPSWAVSAIGSMKRWFGLIADGVILRGTFILKSSGRTVEKELEGIGETITEVETRFEVKEGQISSKVAEVQKYASNAAGSATAAAGSATASEAAKVISVSKASEAKQTAEGFTQTVVETTKKAVEDAVLGADAAIQTKVGTAVTQSAKAWKVEVMGADAQGNPNTVLAAINADASGVQIKGAKVQITGELLAEVIKASGINVNDKFVVNKGGEVKIYGSLSLPYKIFLLTPGTANLLSKDTGFYLYADYQSNPALDRFTATLPTPSALYNGAEFRIYSGFMTTRSSFCSFDLLIDGGGVFYYPGYQPWTGGSLIKVVVTNREVRVRCICFAYASFWYLENYKDFESTDLILTQESG